VSIIQILELSPAGTELFQDSESFLTELSDQEAEILGGGFIITSVVQSIDINSLVTISIGISLRSASAVTVK
jgi:hypothetical protein